MVTIVSTHVYTFLLLIRVNTRIMIALELKSIVIVDDGLIKYSVPISDPAKVNNSIDDLSLDWRNLGAGLSPIIPEIIDHFSDFPVQYEVIFAEIPNEECFEKRRLVLNHAIYVIDIWDLLFCDLALLLFKETFVYFAPRLLCFEELFKLFVKFVGWLAGDH